ncbi:MAG: acetyl-CoA synthase subunit gamma [Clostridia bacterium]|nr:acetyl-CoA synthase subunit gamma [Clostridia bacterium]
MNVKASRSDAYSILSEIKQTHRAVVSDRYVRHILKDNKVDLKMHLIDYLWNLGIRLGINRNNYKVPTGLYEFGTPSADSPVLVTCNYKLTFDYLRRYLKKDYWVLVIDTDGVNVWCAAGKGRFGTLEVVRMLLNTKLSVNHNEIILPQLAAPGVESHLVTKITKKKIIYGPVRIEDMDAFIEHGITEPMRHVTFNLKNRLLLAPIELISSLKYMGAAYLLGLLPFMPKETFWIFLAASAIGNVLHPVLLPVLPFKRFFLNGLLLSALLLPFVKADVTSIGVVMLGMLYTSFITLNFTGSTTFTSLTGVEREMSTAIPFMLKWGAVATLTVIVGILMEVL